MKIMHLICLCLIFSACQNQDPMEYAKDWSINVKNNILNDVTVEIDSLNIDTTKLGYFNHTFYNKGIRLKEFEIRPIEGDTIVSIFYSKNQNFELIRELCPAEKRSTECIKYKGEFLGLTEFKYCNGRIKERGYRYKGDVGIWKEFDEDGNVIKECNFFAADLLYNLRKIKYND